MLSSVHWELRRPLDDKLFEQLIRDLFAAHWNDPNTQINGRSGQDQDGVDVYGRPNRSVLWFGIQCKLREEGKLTRAKIEEEIKMARSFRHKLDTYIIATTLPRDTELQKIIEDLSEIEKANDSFKVQIKFWQDICSLLDENPRLIGKYYGKGGHPVATAYQPDIQKSDEITENSPLLVGVIIDMSRSMIDLLAKMPKRSGISRAKLSEAINILVEKAIAFCKTPEADDVLPRLALFVYGYGFTTIRKRLAGFLKRIGIHSQSLEPQLIPSAPVRDLFSEIAAKESLPFTPTASELNLKWEYYRDSIEAQFLDAGSGNSILYETLCVVLDRFTRELERPYHKYPLMLLISDGQLVDSTDGDLFAVANGIKQLGVQIVCCYIGLKDLTEPKRLFDAENSKWSEEAKRLFHCASETSDENNTSKAIVEIAKEKGWIIPNKAKLFIQANNGAMLEELVEILLSPLND